MVIETDVCSIARPHPSVLRMLAKAKSRLSVAGIKVVEWEPYKSMELLEMIVGSLELKKVAMLIMHRSTCFSQTVERQLWTC